MSNLIIHISEYYKTFALWANSNEGVVTVIALFPIVGAIIGYFINRIPSLQIEFTRYENQPFFEVYISNIGKQKASGRIKLLSSSYDVTSLGPFGIDRIPQKILIDRRWKKKLL